MEELLHTIITFIEAETWQESQRLVEQHPELLHTETDLLLQQLARAQDDEEMKYQVEEHRALLGRCREVGIDETFKEKLGLLRTARIVAHHPPGFEPDMARIMELSEQGQSDPSALSPLAHAVEGVLSRSLSDEYAAFRAAMLFLLGNTYSNSLTGDREENLSHAIMYFEQALQIYTLEATPSEYAMTQNYLGNVYADRQTGDWTKNLLHAIECYKAALTVYTSQTAPYEYADVYNHLGLVYHDLPIGNRSNHLANAIDCYQRALAIYALRPLSLDYAMVQNNLGNAYADLPTGDRADNLARAIECYKAALTICTPEKAPNQYACVQLNLGNAYAALPLGNRSENQNRAIECYKAALTICTPKNMPQEYATVQNSMGLAYYDLPTGDRTDNLARAIKCYKAALTVYTLQTAPLDYAMVQNNLGLAYADLLTGDRSKNLQDAITCYEEVLQVCTFQAAPRRYAAVQQNLGDAYRYLPAGDKSKNLRCAIECYEAALTVYTSQASPDDYAGTQNSLGAAYTNLPIGDRTENLRRAIGCYKAALTIYTPQTTPQEYAAVQNNLGTAYSDLPIGDRAENLTHAIECYKAALTVYTPQTTPLEYARTRSNLGVAYADLPKGDQTENLKYAIACYEEALHYETPEIAPYAYAGTQNNLGTAYLTLPTDREANLARAAACFQKALSIYTLEITSHEYRLTNRNLGNLYFNQRNWASALVVYHAAMEAGERLYRAGMSTESKAAEVAENAVLYRNAAYAAAQLRNPAEALLILERGKTRLLIEALHLQIPRPVNVPDVVWAAFAQAGAAVRTAQSTSALALDEKENMIQAYETREQISQAANAALDLSIEHVRKYAPDFLREISLSTILALFPDEHTGLVAFCCTEQGSMGLVVCRNHVQMVDIPGFTQTALHRLLIDRNANGNSIGGWLVSYQRYLKERSESAFDTWRAVMMHTLREIGQHLLTPILVVLPSDVEQLVFLPSGELFLFPLHAVPLSANTSDLVCDHYQVIYAPSIEVLINSRIKSMREREHSLYAVINPTTDLIFALVEGAAIAQLSTECRVDEGPSGTKGRVLAEVSGRTYVHFACRSSYDWENPSASGLDLADGRLTLTELQSGAVDLTSALLVTLSACESGMVDVIKGSAEEYVGVPAGFLLAGVPCVVSSLWAVPDLSTTLLMERFYRNHLSNGMNFATALHEAQKWLRGLSIGEVMQYAEQWYRQSRQKEKAELFRCMRYYRHQAKHDPTLRPFAHPYYWAAFTCTGA